MLIKDGYVVTPRDEGILIIKNGAVAIEEDRIVAVGRSDEVSGNYKILHKPSSLTVINVDKL